MDQSMIFAAIAEHVRMPDLSRSTGPSPLAFADPDTTRQVLTGAGFDDVAVEGIEARQYWGKDADDATGFLFGFGPLRHWLREANADPGTEERARQAAADAFRTYQAEHGVQLMGRYWLVTAVHP